jgi:hypothetical protein
VGEWSRRIGEVGEEVIGEFLDLIGWTDPQRAGQTHMNLNAPYLVPSNYLQH